MERAICRVMVLTRPSVSPRCMRFTEPSGCSTSALHRMTHTLLRLPRTTRLPSWYRGRVILSFPLTRPPLSASNTIVTLDASMVCPRYLCRCNQAEISSLRNLQYLPRRIPGSRSSERFRVRWYTHDTGTRSRSETSFTVKRSVVSADSCFAWS